MSEITIIASRAEITWLRAEKALDGIAIVPLSAELPKQLSDCQFLIGAEVMSPGTVTTHTAFKKLYRERESKGLKTKIWVHPSSKPSLGFSTDHSGYQPTSLSPLLDDNILKKTMPHKFKPAILYRKVAESRRNVLREIELLSDADPISLKLRNLREGKPQRTNPSSLVSVILASNRPAQVLSAVSAILLQNYPRVEIQVGLHGYELPQTTQKIDFEKRGVVFHTFSEKKNVGYILNKLVERSQGKVIMKMDDDDHYSSSYLKDMAFYLKGLTADFVAKPPFAAFLEAKNKTYMRYSGIKSSLKLCSFNDLAEGRYAIVGSAQAGTRDFFTRHPFDEDNFGSVDSHTIQLHRSSCAKIAISHEFNYIAVRREDKNSHSWKLEDTELIKSAYVLSNGLAKKEIFLNT